ncbi:hypothetical protein [Lactococcus petauri]|uniref:hypothetical protein n=1 Tax=Lactococcus petauri TaxID=1940789 RepID=UPI001F58D14F|nr:hypothetical protein [Lactococcus petauri]
MARSSDYFGDFIVLDERLENIEKLLIGFVPQGVQITIKRVMNVLPSVYIDTWEYGTGIVPLGEEPEGMFGGTTPQIVENRIISWSDNELVLQVALDYEHFKFKYRPESGEYLFFDGVKSLMVHVDGGEAIGTDTDESQVIVTKNRATPTQSNILQRLVQLEERIERE